jgi:tetratricopeptide (TPR) repeat protein
VESNGFTDDLEVVKADGRMMSSAVQNLNEAVNGDDRRAASLAAGRLREISRRLGAAHYWYEQALEQDANDGEAKARLALVFLKSGDTDRALELAEETTKADERLTFFSPLGLPTSAMTVLANAREASGRTAEAIDAYRSAVDIQPEDAFALTRLVLLLLEQDEHEEAQRFAAQLPDSPEKQLAASVFRLTNEGLDRVPRVRATSFSEVPVEV